MLGEKLKALREAKGLLQREVAAVLDVDTAYVSKMEKNDKPVSKNYLGRLSVLFEVDEIDLTRLWLANKVLQTVKNEQLAFDAINLVLNELKRKQ